MKMRNLIILAFAAVMLVACKPSEDITYMNNIDKIPSEALRTASSQAGDFRIKAGDLLHINVVGSNEDAVKPFNKQPYITAIGGTSYNIGDPTTVFYLVDDNMNIDFPVLGRLHIGGMTKKGVEEYITSLIYPRYLTERPAVECRIQNFRIFCIGDFGHPGVIRAENGRLNLIEAIAQSGDLQITGQRDNLLLIRTESNGQRYTKRINLNDASFISSPEYELQQNDILYVEPNRYKKRSIWSASPTFTFGLSMLGTAMSLITFVTVLAK
jgi:polysaccharide export outer membrane protein